MYSKSFVYYYYSCFHFFILFSLFFFYQFNYSYLFICIFSMGASIFFYTNIYLKMNWKSYTNSLHNGLERNGHSVTFYCISGRTFSTLRIDGLSLMLLCQYFNRAYISLVEELFTILLKKFRSNFNVSDKIFLNKNSLGRISGIIFGERRKM